MARMDVTIDQSWSFDADKLEQAVSGRLFRFCERVMGVSKERVPVLTGALMNTGTVSIPYKEGNAIVVDLSYGSQSVDYALAVHENMDANVHWTRPGSGPKYLENPVKEMQGELPDELADAAREALES